jgi:hypothetical protein
MDKVEVETASARVELKELKKKFDSEEWAQQVMLDLRPFASLSLVDAGKHLRTSIQRKIDENEQAAKAPDGPAKKQVGMI